MKRVLSMILAMTMVLALFAGCGGGLTVPTAPAAPVQTQPNTPDETKPAAELTFAEGTILRMATGYNSNKTGLFMAADVAGDGITLADGKTYQAGDLKPTWVEVENLLGMKFEDKYQGNSAKKEFEFWKDRLNEVDMISGQASQLAEFGVKGSVVNIAEYLDIMSRP